MLTRPRRSGERGQTLVIAVAMLGFFGVFAATVLTFAGVVQSQRGLTETTAAVNSVAEGSAQFALADTGIQGCGTVAGGTMKFATGSNAYDTLTYTAGGGACQASTTSASGQNCGLCVLGSGTPVSVQKGHWNVPGEVDVNGSVSLASLTSGVRIGLFGAGATCSSCTPGAVALAQKVLDPLAGALPIPVAGTPKSASGGTICPGTYSTISGNVYMAPWGSAGCAASSSPSLYIITGGVSDSGGGSIVANGSTLYFAPAATVGFTGNGSLSVNCGGGPAPPASCVSTAPATGPYAGVSVFFDPANTSAISMKGNGSYQFGGTVEASHASIDLKGNGGSQSFVSGRLIIASISGSGNGGSAMGFSGPVTSATGCNYWTDSLSGTLAGGSAQPAHVRFETACNVGSPTAIIDFEYDNGH